MTDIETAFAAAARLHQAGEYDRAEAAYRHLLSEAGSHAPTLCNLGVLLTRKQEFDEAGRLYALALASTPGYPDAHYNLGNLHRRRREWADAARHYRDCLANNPRHTSAAFNLGLVLSDTGDVIHSAEAYRLVTRLEPNNANAHMRLGDVLVRSGQLPEGIVSFRAALAVKPDDPRALYNLGLALANAGESQEAQECLQKATKLKPDYAEAHNAIGLNLEATGRKDDAIYHYQKAAALKPDLADAWSNLGTSLAEMGQTDDALNCLRESLARRPVAPAVHSNLLLLLNYTSGLDPLDVLAEHKAWASTYAPPTPPPHPVTDPDPERRLRIGYLSSDFRTHTLAGFLELLLTHHDREQVEVFAYASVLRPDAVTARLQTLADHWRAAGPLTDARLFDQIHADGIDILIDLNGHTAGNRLLVVANRPAPVVMTLFGYPNTTGLDAVDYRITDPVSDPEGATEALSTERLLRLDGPAWVYAPPSLNLPVGPLPSLAQKPFTLGCLNNPAKISAACLDAWGKILQNVAGTRLVILAGSSQTGRKRLADRFTRAGILRDRVELVPRLAREDYFQKYNELDIALDPFPYNGGVTTGDALWMGVPVLTVAGHSYAARQGVMANAALGLGEFTAASPDDLPAIVKSWTQRRPELANLRAELRHRLMTSRLGDAAGYARRLETGYRLAWRERLAAE